MATDSNKFYQYKNQLLIQKKHNLDTEYKDIKTWRITQLIKLNHSDIYL